MRAAGRPRERASAIAVPACVSVFYVRTRGRLRSAQCAASRPPAPRSAGAARGPTTLRFPHPPFLLAPWYPALPLPSLVSRGFPGANRLRACTWRMPAAKPDTRQGRATAFWKERAFVTQSQRRPRRT